MVELGNDSALIWFVADEPLRLETLDGFPHRRPAYAQSICQIDFQQPAAGGKPAAFDFTNEPRVSRLGAGQAMLFRRRLFDLLSHGPQLSSNYRRHTVI